MVIRRLYFTVFEILIVIAILGIIGGFVGINIRKAVYEQNFRSEVELVVSQLRLAQDLMLIFNGEVKVRFQTPRDGSSMTCSLVFASDMPAGWAREAKRVQKLSYIRGFYFPPQEQLDEAVSKPVEEGDYQDISFFSNGSAMSKGVMVLSAAGDIDSDSGLRRYIRLPGYPSPIVSTSSYEEAYVVARDDESFNSELTRRTAAEVQFLKEKASGPDPAGGEAKK